MIRGVWEKLGCGLQVTGVDVRKQAGVDAANPRAGVSEGVQRSHIAPLRKERAVTGWHVFDELCHLLQAKGFRMRVSGSHHIFTKSGVMERINLQREGSKAKPYQIRQVRKILAQYKLF